MTAVEFIEPLTHEEGVSQATKLFVDTYGAAPEGVWAAPGRVNLIGEHTDYNGGFVFPGAVDCGITAMIRPNGTDRVRAYAVDLDSYAEFGLREEDKPSESWARYIFGVCREIQKRGGRIINIDYRLNETSSGHSLSLIHISEPTRP